MTIRQSPVLLLALLVILAMIAYGQDGDDAKIIEEDYRVTSVEDRQRSVTNLLRNVDDFRKSGQLIEAARTLNRVGRFQIRMSVPEDAVTTFQEALKFLAQQPDIKTRIDSLNGLASSYDYLSKCNLAEPHAEQAITLSKQNNYVAGQAEGLLTLSDCQNHRDHSLALKSAQESLALWQSIDRKRGMAEAHKVIGHDQILQNNLVECSQSMEAALNLYRELNDLEQQASVLVYLAKVEHQKGAYQNALALYTRVQSMTDEQAEPYKMGQIAYGLGDAFLESGLPEIALAKFSEGLEYFRKTKNQRAVSILFWSIGRAHYFLGDHQKALDNLEAARKAAKSSRDVTVTAFCDDFLGRTRFSMGEPTTALSHFRSALEGYSSAKNTMEVARTHALIGQVYEQQGDLARGRMNYETALDRFRSLEDHVNESATLHALGKLELKQGHLDVAEKLLRQSIDVTEDIRRISTSNDLTAAFSAAVYDRYQSYIECLMQKHKAHPDQGFDARAFEISEQARARSLLEMLRATGTSFTPGVDPKLVDEEKSLRQSLRVKEDYKVALLGKDYKREELVALETELARLDSEYKRVVQVIQTRYPAYQQITKPEHYGTRQIQEKIIVDDQTVLLEYILGPERSYVWAVTRDRITSYELPSQAAITEKAQTLYRMLMVKPDANNSNDVSRAAQELGSLVLAPVAAELQKQTVIIVADGALNYVPFQLLPKSSSSSEPLVATSDIVNAPSASILGVLNQGRPKRQRGKLLAAFGAPVFDSNVALKASDAKVDLAAAQKPENRLNQPSRDIQLNGDSFDPSVITPLIFANRELANLRDVTSSDEAFVATDYDASRDELLKTDLTKYSILHFATHGRLDPRHPENSALILSTVTREGKPQNGLVSLQDIYQLRAPVDLVVLSACQTALGKDVRGEGLIGLTRGFMYAGAASVVASLWKVDDEATAELMKRFYANMLGRGMTPAAALRAAQNSIRAEPQWQSPYFWAAFTLQGEYRQAIKPASAYSIYGLGKIVAGLSLLLVVIAVVWWYRNVRAKKDGAATLQ